MCAKERAAGGGQERVFDLGKVERGDGAARNGESRRGGEGKSSEFGWFGSESKPFTAA